MIQDSRLDQGPSEISDHPLMPVIPGSDECADLYTDSGILDAGAMEKEKLFQPQGKDVLLDDIPHTQAGRGQLQIWDHPLVRTAELAQMRGNDSGPVMTGWPVMVYGQGQGSMLNSPCMIPPLGESICHGRHPGADANAAGVLRLSSPVTSDRDVQYFDSTQDWARVGLQPGGPKVTTYGHTMCDGIVQGHMRSAPPNTDPHGGLSGNTPVSQVSLRVGPLTPPPGSAPHALGLGRAVALECSDAHAAGAGRKRKRAAATPGPDVAWTRQGHTDCPTRMSWEVGAS